MANQPDDLRVYDQFLFYTDEILNLQTYEVRPGQLNISSRILSRILVMTLDTISKIINWWVYKSYHFAN